MKVLLWSPGGAGTHYYGPGSYAFRLYRHRYPERLHVSLVHGSDEQEKFPKIFERQKFLSVIRPVSRSSIFSPLSPFEHYGRRVAFIRSGTKWLDENIQDFDIFHGMGNFSDTLLPALHARKLGVPACTVVISMRAELEDQRRWRQWLKISERRLALISQLDAVVACSRDIEHMLLERGVSEKKVVYIPICVDPSQFGPAESDSAKRSLRGKLGLRDDPTIAYVGELTEREGAHLLLQALREVAAFHTGWQLVIAGPRNDEQYARQLEAYVDDQGWREHVHFLGHVNNIEAVYKSADIFCLPSRDEGMPGALLEAMATELACIVTPFSGARELINDGTSGRIVSRSPYDIANALKEYLGDESLRRRHGSGARQTVLAGYTTKKVLCDHMSLFGRLQARETPRWD